MGGSNLRLFCVWYDHINLKLIIKHYMLCMPVNAYRSRSILVLFISIHVSPYLLYYFILFCLSYFYFILIFRVANQIPIIHMSQSRRWGCLVVYFCYQLMARLDGRTVAPSWPGPYEISQYLVIYSNKMKTRLCTSKVLHEPACMCVLFYRSLCLI